MREDNTWAAAGIGALSGAAVGGPLGLVIGGIAGAILGNEMETDQLLILDFER
jgi:outer membrane lipoprotein SlyB